ncbi:MAG TPA: RagB/SusD family nutrient uptake outer membrane protein [Gemmatimonadaceae bacterium]|nr:RagB/SusD family nutrient uptake outer membrane protein [Gemmatimonadaceae bacterium]
MTQAFSKYLAALTLGGALLLAAEGCTNVTETPYGEVTAANFHPTANDLTSLMAPVYTPQRQIWMGWYGMVDFQSETADDMITPVRPLGWYDGGTYIRLHKHTWGPTQGQPEDLWERVYRGINAANRVFYQIESGVVPLDEATEASALAELRAMRAYYYSILLDNFGNVPVVTDFTAAELPQQSTRQEVYDFVVKELTESIPNLSEVADGTTYGRMNKWAALGVLARVQLNAEVYTGTPHWEDVISLTQQIIESNLYSLDPQYLGPFRVDNENSPEIIFAVPYDAVYATGSNFHMKTLKPDLRYVFKLNGTPWGGTAADPQFIDTYDPEDERLQQTWLMGDYFDDAGHGYTFVQHVKSIEESECYCAGFPMAKYEIYAGETGSSSVDFPALRYAEVLMMKAEALLRTGHADDAALIVSEVRQRDFDGTNPAKATVTGADLMQGSSYNYGWMDVDGVVKDGPGGTPTFDGGADVQYGRFLDELGWEFVGEAQRRQQLIRFGVFTTKTWFNHTPMGDYRAIFPIPQSAMNTNSNLTQNPGY